jgi:hypothetical protein
MAEESQFNLEDCQESISKTFSPEILEQLNQMEDFRKAYEINPELKEIFREVGILEDLGLGGLMPSEWAEFGPVQKTLAEFKSAYDTFQKEMVSILQEHVRNKKRIEMKKKEKTGTGKKG